MNDHADLVARPDEELIALARARWDAFEIPASYRATLRRETEVIEVGFQPPPILYLPHGQRYTTSIWVDLLAGNTGSDFEIHPDAPKMGPPDWARIPPYVEGPEHRAAVARFLAHCNRDRDPALPPVTRDDFLNGPSVLISDAGDHDAVLVVSTHQESSYKLDKITGAVSDAWHAHLAPMPDLDAPEP